MGDLPTGTLTLLFSDIEGSTSLVSRLGTAWSEALSAHRRVLRASFGAHGGVEMGTEGDSFFVVFTSAAEAVRAAVEGQRGLLAHEWPEEVPLRVRMGLHTGEPQRHEDGYIGLDVHRAARIAATAHGAQIVVSSSTVDLLGSPADVTVRDLGWHRLKDLVDPEHLFEIVGEGLPQAHPPLRSLGTRAKLPTFGTDMIGREADVAHLTGALRDAGARLVTMTGPGGTGKTRLAVAVAAEMERWVPGGTYFVTLDSTYTTSSMWSAIVEAVGVPPDGDRTPAERALRFLAGRRALVVLDNLEQIVDADLVVSRLLADAPAVSVVATSRKPLHLAQEHQFPVSPLVVPAEESLASVQAAPTGAVDLFVRRARMVKPSFTLTDQNVGAVVALCGRLDGLPLAIELAAARLGLLSPTALLARLDEKLAGEHRATDRAERQRTLDSTIAWSYDLLDPPTQEGFRSLGVFAGRFDLPAVAQVLGSDEGDPLDLIDRLVDVSLVVIADGQDGEPTARMLETIRRYARLKLAESDELDRLSLRHARWCVERTQQAADLLGGPRQMSATDRMDAIHDDVLAALSWCFTPGGAQPDRLECGFALLSPMFLFWYRFGRVIEGRAWLDRAVHALDSGGLAVSPGVLDALHGHGVMALQEGDLITGTAALERAWAMAQDLGDEVRQARESNSLGVARREAGDLVGARSLLQTSLELARRTGDASRLSGALSNMVVVLTDSGEHSAAVRAAQEAIVADESLGDPWGVAINQSNLVVALLNAEGPQRAFQQAKEIVPSAASLGDVELTIDLIESLCCIWAAFGDGPRAARLLGTADAQRELAGIPRKAPDEQHIDRFVARLRESLPRDDWERARTEGRSRGIDQALAEGLSAQRGSVLGSTSGPPT